MGELLYLRPADRATLPLAVTRRKASGLGHVDGPLVALIDRYTRERIATAAVTRGTARDQRLTLLSFSDTFGQRRVNTLGESDVIRWLETILEDKPGTRRNKFSVVKGFCRWLVRKGHVKRDPFLNLRAPKVPREVPKIYEPEEVEAMYASAPDARAFLVMTLVFEMGLRIGEVATLELGDFRSKSLVVRGKGSHERALPIVSALRPALAKYLPERGGWAGPVIENYNRRGHGVSPHTLSHLWRQWARDAGVKQYAHDGKSAHGGRRTCFTEMVENGADPYDVQAAAGHASTATGTHYVKHRTSRLAEVMDRRREVRLRDVS